MKDAYKAEIMSRHLEALKKDENYTASVSGSAGNPIKLDEGALLLLKMYYKGQFSWLGE